MNAKTTPETWKFTSDIAWIAISQALTMGLGLITLPILTKNYSTDLYGVWAQAGVTVGLLTPILVLQFSTAVVRFLSGEENKEEVRRALGSMLWPILVFSCIGILSSIPLKQSLAVFLFSDAGYAVFIPLTFIWATTNALYTFFLGYLRARGKIKRLSVINFTLAVAKMLIIAVLAIAGFSLEWIIICIITIEALLTIAVFTTIIREIGFPWPNLRGLKGFLAYSLPLIPYGILIWVINASDRYFITHYLGLSQTGIYTASYTLGGVISLFYAPISFVLFPTLAKLWEQKEPKRAKRYLEYSTRLFLFFAIPGTAGLYILSQPVLGIMTGPEYLTGSILVLLVALGTILLGIYQINVFIVHLIKQTKWLPLMVIIAATTNAGINVVLIPKSGIMGAAISTIVSYIIQAAIVTIWARKIISYKIDFKFLGKITLATLVMAFCLWFFPISSILSICIAVIGGAALFTGFMLILKAFSGQDIALLKEVFRVLRPGDGNKEYTHEGNNYIEK